MILPQGVIEELKKEFENLKDKVEIYFKGDGSVLAEKTKAILEDIVSLSDKLELIEKDIECLGYPCVSLGKEGKEVGIKYMGSLEGGEFNTFIKTIKLVSTGNVDLEERTLEFLKDVDKPVEIKVFVTTTCGWCAPVLLKCNSFALANENITTLGIDCYAFPDIANKYKVVSVPKIVINDKRELIGYVPENHILGEIFSAIRD
jgi:glutaredoxin-like protein